VGGFFDCGSSKITNAAGGYWTIAGRILLMIHPFLQEFAEDERIILYNKVLVLRPYDKIVWNLQGEEPDLEEIYE
jgi:hypothetical protein